MNINRTRGKRPSYQDSYLGITAIIGLVALLVVTWITPPSRQHNPILALLSIFIALQYFLWIPLLGSRYNLIHLTLLGSAVFLGTSSAGWAGMLGIMLGALVQPYLPDFTPLKKSQQGFSRRYLIADSGKILLPLVLATTFFHWTSGLGVLTAGQDQSLLRLVGCGVLFGLVHGGLTLAENSLGERGKPRTQRWDVPALLLFELLPLLLLILIVFTYPALGLNALFVLAAIVTFLAMLFHYLGAARVDLERQVQELTALDKISQALTTQIDLHRLLGSIKGQVTRLLGVDNFYVALLDRRDGQIWYPLAVKRGQLQSWPRRPLTDRLTDRVITEGKPILIPDRGHEHLSRNNIPLGEDAPHAWLGVPLIAGDEVIGCLASFSLDPQTTFDQEDLTLFSFLSGQTGVAIEIALHNALLSSDVVIGRDRLTAVLNSVQEGIALLESDGRLTLVNAAMQSILSVPGSDLLGRHLTELPAPILKCIGLSASAAEDFLSRRTLPDGAGLSYQEIQIEIDHVEKVLERSFLPLQGKSGEYSGWIILLRDITEQHQLREARDLLGETLVHDLRAPISSVISALDIVQESFESSETSDIIQPSLEIAQRSARRVLKMVESLLEITRLESGRLELQMADSHLKSLVDQSLAEFSQEAAQVGVKLYNDVPPDLPWLRIDREKIQRVLKNLIDNALKFTHEGGWVRISAEPYGENAIAVRVTDTGPGIPEEYQQKIFERFVQVPGQSARRKGSGLGLTFCQLAVEAHGGKIWVESRPGEGSTFVVVLPCKS